MDFGGLLSEIGNMVGLEGMNLESILTQIQSMPPVSLALLVLGYGIAKIPSIIVQKDKTALKNRDDMIAKLNAHIDDLQSEIKALKEELEALEKAGKGGL